MSRKPAPRHLQAYRQGLVPGTGDGRLHSPSYERNATPIIEVLQQVLGQCTGNALEIGSGTGQHVCAYAAALPALHWTPSDPDETHRRSIDAWTAYNKAPVAPALALDATTDWAQDSTIRTLGPLQAVLSQNVIHIAPWPVAEGIVTGAARSLAAGGWLLFYGPFRQGGVHTSDSNARFDQSLRTSDPAWGVRDTNAISALTDAAGFAAVRMFTMPSNNHILAFRSNS